MGPYSLRRSPSFGAPETHNALCRCHSNTCCEKTSLARDNLGKKGGLQTHQSLGMAGLSRRVYKNVWAAVVGLHRGRSSVGVVFATMPVRRACPTAQNAAGGTLQYARDRSTKQIRIARERSRQAFFTRPVGAEDNSCCHPMQLRGKKKKALIPLLFSFTEGSGF